LNLRRKKVANKTTHKVSILVAARNEADNILDCLRALEALSYPKENLQILVGDDDSDDNTAALAAAFIAYKPQFELIKIASPPQTSQKVAVHSRPQPSESLKLSEGFFGRNIENLKGKTRVLAILAQAATGDFLFFTDADIEVPPHWIENMLPHFKPNVGVVTGITSMTPSANQKGLKSPHRGLGGFQSLEWLYYLSIMRAMSLFEIPVTAMGNNMAVTRCAYDTVGGYEAVGFSITEDYALFRAILDKGFGFQQLYDQRVLTISKPVPTFGQLMIQRKRWMYGAITLPWAQRWGVYANGLLLPILLILAVVWPQIALAFGITSYIFSTAWLMGAISWIGQRQLLPLIPIFWFYHILMNFAMLVNFYTRQQTVWKGRKY
jgi:1,2-diacylglycerol 3-beta-glucosyltransferase